MHKNTQGRVTNPRNGYKLDEKQESFYLNYCGETHISEEHKVFLVTNLKQFLCFK